MRLERAISDSPKSTPIEYASPARTMKPGFIDALVGVVCAILFAAVCYRFAWSVLASCYDVAKHLPGFGPDDIGTWSFAVLNAVIITGPVAAVGAVATVIVFRLRLRRRA